MMTIGKRQVINHDLTKATHFVDLTTTITYYLRWYAMVKQCHTSSLFASTVITLMTIRGCLSEKHMPLLSFFVRTVSQIQCKECKSAVDYKLHIIYTEGSVFYTHLYNLMQSNKTGVIKA